MPTHSLIAIFLSLLLTTTFTSANSLGEEEADVRSCASCKSFSDYFSEEAEDIGLYSLKPLQTGQTVRMNSMIIVDAGSQLTLRFEPIRENSGFDLPMVKGSLEDIFGSGEWKEIEGRFYKTISETNVCRMINISDHELLKAFATSVEGHKGNVCIVRQSIRIFTSNTLNLLYDMLVSEHDTEALDEIHLRRAEFGEKLPPESLILVDDNSELNLQLVVRPEANADESLLEPDGLRRLCLYRYFVGKAQDGKYHATVPEATAHILRDNSENEILQMFDVFVEKCVGNVYVSTNTETISSIRKGRCMNISGTSAKQIEDL